MDAAGLMGYWDEDTLPEWIGGEMTFDDLATRLLLYVIDHHAEHGRGPTYDQMAARFGRSREMIHYRLLVLYDKGLVDWKYKSPGTLHPKVALVRLRPPEKKNLRRARDFRCLLP